MLRKGGHSFISARSDKFHNPVLHGKSSKFSFECF